MVMGKRFVRWLSRAGSALASDSDYVRPRKGDNAGDFARLMGDMRNVGKDLRAFLVKGNKR
jgi:hypothetical protein